MNRIVRLVTVPVLALALAAAVPIRAQAPAPAPAQGAAAAGGASQPALSQDQLDALVAPIALYPDQLLVQTLMASTYPLDVVEAARFVKANKELKGDAMVKAAEAKNWDPSVQSLTAYPQVLEMMNDKLDWTQQLGDAVLADQGRVMQTAQNLRQKAVAAGNLKSNEQQKVVQQEKTIIIEPAQPQTVYVPTYNPAVVYGAWWAPAYPPYYWPPPAYYYPGYVAGAAVVGFGVGLAVGAAWGWAGANWGHNDIDINVNNNFVRNNNNAEFKNKVNNGNWKHNPDQRKGVAYRDQGTRDKFQKSDPGAASARRDYRGHEGGAGNRSGPSAGTMDRGAGAGAGAGAGNRAGPSAGTMDRGGGGAGGIDRGDGPGKAGGGGGGISSASPANRAGGGGQSFGGGSGGGQSFGGGASHHSSGAGSFNSGQNRAQTQSYSNRGASSRSSMSHGGGGARGGGGGGGRGGGGRR